MAGWLDAECVAKKNVNPSPMLVCTIQDELFVVIHFIIYPTPQLDTLFSYLFIRIRMAWKLKY